MLENLQTREFGSTIVWKKEDIREQLIMPLKVDPLTSCRNGA
jgi:hypothetical protein